MILDVCCNLRTWWPLGCDRHIGMDIDAGVKPHVVGNFRRLPFLDASIDEIWADPPHQIRKHVNGWRENLGKGMTRYGCWNSIEVFSDSLKDLRAEALRVLKPGACLYVKLLVRDNPPEPRNRVPTSAYLLASIPGAMIVRRQKSKLPWSRCETILLKVTKQ